MGNVPGALLADRIATRIGNIPTLIGAALVSGLAYLVMASAKGWLLAGVAFSVVSFAVYAGSVIANSLRQSLSPRDLMGRVGSAWRGIVLGAIPIGSLIGGALAVHGLRLPLIIAGVAQCVVALAIARPLTGSLAASERALASAVGASAETASAETASAGSGSSMMAFAVGTPADGGRLGAASCDGDQAVTASLSGRAAPASSKRRLHSRPSRLPFYWGPWSRARRR